MKSLSQHCNAVWRAARDLDQESALRFGIEVSAGLVPIYEWHAEGLLIRDRNCLDQTLDATRSGRWPNAPVHDECVPCDMLDAPFSWSICHTIANGVCDFFEAVRNGRDEVHLLAVRALDLIELFEEHFSQEKLNQLMHREMARQTALLQVLSNGNAGGFPPQFPELTTDRMKSR